MKIYFDNTLIDEDYYTQCSQTGLLFNENDTFKLGSTVCRSFTIGVDKNAISEIPTNIELEFDNVRYKQFRIDKYEENDVEYIFYLVDRMIDLDFKYDASEIFVSGKTTLKQILEDICNKVGIDVKAYNSIVKTEDNKYLTTEDEIKLETENKFNTWWQDKEISWYDNKITAREYIGMIAELNGGYAIINNNNEMEIRSYNNNVVYDLSSLNCDNLKVGNKHEITKVVYDFGIYKYESGIDGETLYINQNNKFITGQSDIDEIYNLINGFEFYTITNQNAMIGKADIGECIRVDNEYLTIVQVNNWKYNVNTWIGGYNLNINSSTLEGSIVQETFTEEHMRDLEVQIDRANNQIVLKATADGHIAQVNLGADADEGSEFDVLADNINFEGKNFNLTSENITINSKNWNMDKNGTMSAYASKTFNLTQNDINIMRAIYNGTILATDEYLEKYDLNGNKIIDIQDIIKAENIVNGSISNIRNTTYLLNTQNTTSLLSIKDDLNSYDGCALGSGGAWLGYLGTSNIDIQYRSTISPKINMYPGVITIESNDREQRTQLSYNSISTDGDLYVYGSKNRVVKTDNGDILLNAYETATPYFGDIGSDTTDENGECIIYIEDLFKQTIENDDYKVFIQECGNGRLYVEKYDNYFIVKGTPNLDFDWEIKAIQKGYKNTRLKRIENKEV